MKLHFLGFLIGSSALSAAIGPGILFPLPLLLPNARLSTLAIPNFKIDARTAATLIARPINVIDLIVAQDNPTFVSKGKISIKT